MTALYRAVLISSIFCISLLLIGCSQKPRFETINAESPQEAFNKLLSQSSRLDRFSSRPVFQFVSDSGRLKAKGVVEYDAETGWNIDVRGPLSLQLALIESKENKFNVHLPYRGSTMEMNGNEKLQLPDLDIELPEISMMAELLAPMLILRDDWNWDVAGGSRGHPGALFLVREEANYRDSLSITLEYLPLRVFEYRFWRDGELIFERSFEYDSVMNQLPAATLIRSGVYEFYITFNIKEFVLLPVQEKQPVL